MAKTRNQTFQYLEAMAIIMVIDDHMSTRIGFLSSLFPYNSFYMPMLVFISGYFFKNNFRDNLKGKIKHLLFPYILWTLAGDFLAYILMKCGSVKWYVTPFSLKNIFKMFFIGPLSEITGPSWFVIMLFWVSVLYGIIRCIPIFKSKFFRYAFTFLSIAIGFVSVYLCMKGYNHGWRLAVLRTTWYLQFYNLGTMFRDYWEKYIAECKGIYICSVSLLVNVLLLCMHFEINFYSTSGMGSFKSWWLPLITSVTGTLFWYKVMQFLSSKIGRVKYIDFIAENTFVIMCCHLFFVNIPNFYCYYKVLAGSTAYSDFPMEKFIYSPWIRYSLNTRLIGFFMGVIGSIITIIVIKKAKSLISKIWQKRFGKLVS